MSGLLGPNGLPIRSQPRQIPDQVIVQYLTDHDARLNALAAQSVHIGIMIEYLIEQLRETVPDFQIDSEDFAEFRARRFEEMKNEAAQIEAENNALRAQRNSANDQNIVDLNEIDDNGEIG